MTEPNAIGGGDAPPSKEKASPSKQAVLARDNNEQDLAHFEGSESEFGP